MTRIGPKRKSRSSFSVRMRLFLLLVAEVVADQIDFDLPFVSSRRLQGITPMIIPIYLLLD